MKKYILPAVIVVALFLTACQNPAGSPGSSGVEVSIDAVASASGYRSYWASYRVDSLKLPRNSIANITMICDFDTVSIDTGSVEYGNSVHVININSEYVRTVYAFADFVTANGDTLRDMASINFTHTTGSIYSYDTCIMRINTVPYFIMHDLFNYNIFHLFSTDPAKKYSVNVNQNDSRVVKLSPLTFMPSMRGDVRFPHPGQSQHFLITISSNSGGKIDTFLCNKANTMGDSIRLLRNVFKDTIYSDTLSLRLSDDSTGFYECWISNFIDKIKNLDSIICTSLDTVNLFRKSYTAADFWNTEEMRQNDWYYFPALCNTSFCLDSRYFYFEIPFENLDMSLCYTLQIEFTDGRPPVIVFNNVPFPQLVHAGSQW
jgi:hypothetical protein